MTRFERISATSRCSNRFPVLQTRATTEPRTPSARARRRDLLARAVALIGSVPLNRVDAILAEADATFTNAGYFDDALGAPAIGVFAAAVAGDDDLVRERRAALLVRSEGRRPRSWLAIADTWAGETDHSRTITWPQGAAEAMAAWSGVLEARRNAATDVS